MRMDASHKVQCCMQAQGIHECIILASSNPTKSASFTLLTICCRPHNPVILTCQAPTDPPCSTNTQCPAKGIHGFKPGHRPTQARSRVLPAPDAAPAPAPVRRRRTPRWLPQSQQARTTRRPTHRPAQPHGALLQPGKPSLLLNTPLPRLRLLPSSRRPYGCSPVAVSAVKAFTSAAGPAHQC